MPSETEVANQVYPHMPEWYLLQACTGVFNWFRSSNDRRIYQTRKYTVLLYDCPIRNIQRT